MVTDTTYHVSAGTFGRLLHVVVTKSLRPIGRGSTCFQRPCPPYSLHFAMAIATWYVVSFYPTCTAAFNSSSIATSGPRTTGHLLLLCTRCHRPNHGHYSTANTQEHGLEAFGASANDIPAYVLPANLPRFACLTSTLFPNSPEPSTGARHRL